MDSRDKVFPLHRKVARFIGNALASELLEATSLSVEEIAEEAGFNSSSSFRRQFRAYYQVSPRLWRRNFNNESE